MIDDLDPGTVLLLRRYFAVMLLLAVVFVAIGGYVAYGAYTGDEYRTDREVTATWTPETRFDHSATVRNESSVFERGDVLTNRPMYFSRVAPELDGTYVVSHAGDVEAATVTVDLALELRAVENRGGDSTVHWRETEPLASKRVADLEPGERREIPFSVSIASLERRLDAIEDELGTSPGTTEIVITAETEIETATGDESFVDTRTDTLELEPGGNTYRVTANLADDRQYEATDRVQTPVESSPLASYGGVVLALGGIASLSVLGWGRHRGLFAVTAADRARVEYRRARADFDDWISAGTVPEDDDRTRVTVESLAAISDVAIDTDRRVIEVDGSAYVVLVEDVRYVYEPPADVAVAVSETKNEPAIGTPSATEVGADDAIDATDRHESDTQSDAINEGTTDEANERDVPGEWEFGEPTGDADPDDEPGADPDDWIFDDSATIEEERERSLREREAD